MLGFLFALIAVTRLAGADERLPGPLSSGTLLDWTGSDSGGNFTYLTAAAATHRCLFTGKTYFEREHRRIRISLIPKGEPLEVLSERLNDPPACRALIVRVVRQAPVHPPGQFRRPWSTPTESFAPRGNLLLSGVVVRKDDPYLWVRTRNGKSHMVVIRPDTRISTAGLPADRAAIPYNQPVFIRAGRSLDGDIEAYTMVWGEILRPVPGAIRR